MARQVLVAVAGASSGSPNAAALRAAIPREQVIGLFRDLQGVTMATTSRKTYGEGHTLWGGVLWGGRGERTLPFRRCVVVWIWCKGNAVHVCTQTVSLSKTYLPQAERACTSRADCVMLMDFSGAKGLFHGPQTDFPAQSVAHPFFVGQLA